MKQITCPHCGDTYPDFDVSHVCSKGPYAIKLKPQMNERIKKLALEAGIGFTLWDDSGREMIDNYTPEEYLDKFAELIVREILVTCEEHAAWPGRVIGELIKKHFGVEE